MDSTALRALFMSSLVLVAACGAKGGATASTSASAAAAAASGSAAPEAKKNMGTAKHDFAEASNIYKGIFTLKSTALQAEKVEAMKNKLGPADKVDGDKSIWYAADGAGGCYAFTAGPSGAGFEATEKSACGL